MSEALQGVLHSFHEVAVNPKAQKERYLQEGKKIVLTAPVYTPEELVHAMGLVPFGAWGADMPLNQAKEYFPAFICSIMQSILELGMAGAYEGVSALVVPTLCDSLKCLGQNWKYAVPAVPFIPMTYPQNRRAAAGQAFTKAGYERVIRDLEQATGETFQESALAASIQVYNEHNRLMRQADALLARHPEVHPSQRSDIYKSAWFLRKEEHSQLLREFIDALESTAPEGEGVPVMTTGILCDSPSLLRIFDSLGFQIVADDVAAESRQYRVDTPEGRPPLEALCEKFSQMDHCSVLYDPEKKRPGYLVETAKVRGAKGIVLVLTKFCDPEEFDYPMIKRACEQAGLPLAMVEIDRQMENYEQAGTLLEAFRDLL